MQLEIKKKQTALLMFLVMMVSLFQGTIVQPKAAFAAGWPAITSSKYMKCYAISTKNNTTVYTSSTLKTKLGVIYGTDELYVYSINDSWAYLSYPVKSGRKYGYVPTKVLTANNQNHSSGKATAKIITTKRAGGAAYGYIAKDDLVMRVATSGNYSQVIYPAGAKWKMGWITTSSYNKYISGSSSSTYSNSSAAGKLSSYSAGVVHCYTLASSGKLYAYSDAALKNKVANSYIACASDELYVQSVNLTYGSVKLSYPVSSGRKSMYFKIGDIMASPASQPYTYYANHRIYTYRWAGSKQYGYIENENAVVVGVSGSYTQIIYSIGSGQYKMAFIKTSDMVGSGNASSTSKDDATVRQNIYKLALDSVGTQGTYYQTWYGVSSTTPYCVIYAMYIARTAMANAGYSSSQIDSVMPRYAATSLWASYYNSKGRYYSFTSWRHSVTGISMSANSSVNSYSPQVGDLAAVDNCDDAAPDHTGIVIAVNGNTLTMAEGNTGAGTNATRTVKIYTYYKGGSYWYRSDYSRALVIGFGNPAY